MFRKDFISATGGKKAGRDPMSFICSVRDKYFTATGRTNDYKRKPITNRLTDKDRFSKRESKTKKGRFDSYCNNVLPVIAVRLVRCAFSL